MLKTQTLSPCKLVRRELECTQRCDSVFTVVFFQTNDGSKSSVMRAIKSATYGQAIIPLMTITEAIIIY
jgi:hypothetical protein